MTVKTPTGVIKNNPYQVGQQMVSFTDLNTIDSPINSIRLVSCLNDSFLMEVPMGSWSTNRNITSFNVGLYAGAYRLLVNTERGYFSFNDTVNVDFPSNT